MATTKTATETKSADAAKAGKGKAVKNAAAALKGSLNTGTKLANVPGGTKAAKSAKAPAAAKAPKAEKAPKAAKAEGSNDARSAYADTAKIKVLKSDHTFREGSIRGESFAAMKKAKTVGEYVQGGGLTKHLTRFQDLGLIEIA